MSRSIDISGLNAARPAIKKMIEGKVSAVRDKVALDVHHNVVLGTPVDTGEARGGWTVDLPSGPFQDAKIENNVEHIVFLANGGSKQAPAGWIDNAIEAATKLGGGNA